MKKLVVLIVVAVVVAAQLLLACAPAAPAPGPAITPTPTPVTPIVFKADSVVVHWPVQSLTYFSQVVEERSKGRLKIEVYPGGASGHKGSDYLYLVDKGIMEMVETWGSGTGEPALEMLASVPGLIPNDLDFRIRVLKAMYPDWKKFIEKRYNVYLLGWIIVEWRNMMTVKKITSLAELKGLKIRTATQAESDFTKALGATPVVMEWGPVYTALQQGMLDGLWNADAGNYGAHIDEVCKYLIAFEIGGGSGFYLVNKDAVDRLPPDLRDILWDAARNVLQPKLEAELRLNSYQARVNLISKGVQQVNLSAADLKTVREVAKPIVDSMAAKLSGTPEASALFDKLSGLVAEYLAGKK